MVDLWVGMDRIPYSECHQLHELYTKEDMTPKTNKKDPPSQELYNY
jgi:hypothetical protein